MTAVVHAERGTATALSYGIYGAAKEIIPHIH